MGPYKTSDFACGVSFLMTQDAKRATAPRFCSECRTVESDRSWDRPFCAHCGGSLVDQSYCAICEDYWRLPAGDPCPKHEIPLEPNAPEPLLDPASGPTLHWETVHRFPHTLAAAGARIRLEAEGIPTFIEGERMGSRSMYQVATDGVKLQVPAHLAADARVILKQTWMSRPPEDPDDDLDDAWDDLAPSATARVRSINEVIHLFEAFVLLLILGPILFWLVARFLGFV
jgi:hypothetical protein